MSFCGACGAPVTTAFCPNCGASVRPQGAQGVVPAGGALTGAVGTSTNPPQPTGNAVPPIGSQFIGKWNWGAFLLTPFWLMNHRRPWRGILALVPYVNIVISIAYGIVGNRVAVESGRFRDEQQFVAVQNSWRNAGFIVIALVIVLSIIAEFISPTRSVSTSSSSYAPLAKATPAA